MPRSKGRRLSLLLLVGVAAAGVLIAAPWSAGAPDDPHPGPSVLTGRVLGLAKGAKARVEVRRVAPPTDPETLWWWPPRGECDERRLEPWFASGSARGDPLRSVDVEGPDASFRVGGLPVGIFEVRLAQGGRVVGTATAVLQAAGQHVEVALSAPSGHLHLGVRLRWKDGRPFQGVVVVEQAERGLVARPWLDGAREVRPDVTGLVEIAGLHPGPFELTALVPGRLRIEHPFSHLPQGGTLAWVIDGECRLLAGTVVRRTDGKPVAGARVRVLGGGGEDEALTLARTTTDTEGRFHLPAQQGYTSVFVAADGLAPAWLTVDAEEQVGTIHLDQRATVEGFVTGPDGAPLAGTLVHALPTWSLEAHRAPLEARTTSTGFYRLSVPPGEVQVYVREAGHISLHLGTFLEEGPYPLPLTVAPGTTCRFDVATERAQTHRGRVVDEKGAPVAGALIDLGIGVGPDAHVATAADGTFSVHGGTAGPEWGVGVQEPGFLRGRFGRLSTDASPVVLGLRHGLTFTVGVRTTDGDRPLARARVRLQHQWTREELREGRTREVALPDGTTMSVTPPSWRVGYSYDAPDAWTDGEGHARVGPVPPGKARVTVEAPGFDTAKLLVDVQPGSTIGVHLRRTEPIPRRPIRGRIVLPEGVQTTAIGLRHSGPDAPLVGTWGKDGGRSVAVASDGTFQTEGLEEGRYGLRAFAWAGGHGFFVQVTAAAGASDVELRLLRAPWMKEPPRELGSLSAWTFRIVDPDGRPVEGGLVTSGLEGRQCPRSFRRGRLHVPARAGQEKATFWFHDAVDECGVWLPLGWAQAGPLPPGGGPVTVVLPAERVFRGIVLGPDGHGVRGLRVSAVADLGADDDFPFERSALTGADGTFTLGGLGGKPKVPYLLHVGVPLEMARLDPVHIPANWYEEDVLPLRLHEAVAPDILVVDGAGTPLPKASVCLEPDEDDCHTFEDNTEIEGFYSGPGWVDTGTDAQGHARFKRLDPHRAYRLSIGAPEDRPDLGPYENRAWRPDAVQVIHLQPWATLHGVVHDEKGALVPGAVIWVQEIWNRDWDKHGTADTQGRFSLDHLPPGEIGLLATRPEDPPADEHPDSEVLHTTTSAGPVVLLVR